MRATGSKTIVTRNVFVPATRVLRFLDLVQGRGPGGALHESPLYRTAFYFYAPLTFVAPMLGAARAAYERFREWTRTRQAIDGTAVAEKTSIQVRMARAAADLDAAELLLRRTLAAPDAPQSAWPQLVARSVRDFARASELAVAAIDALIAMGGTAGFAASHPLQRAWRDIHFASTHIALNSETNYAHFGRMELGLPPAAGRPFL
jgi:alkylation response protein AidB-like acyl-CoA dehydrogenase